MEKLVSDILNVFENIIGSRKKLINELEYVVLNTTNYPNVKYDKDATQHDKLNKALLDDLDKAGRTAGVVLTITTASSGHPDEGTDKSRHSKFIAVDISRLNGIGSNGATNDKNGNPEFRVLGNRVKDALVSMGYVWNTEKYRDKAVLWQTNTGGNHFNHLHVSNRTGLESEIDPTISSDTDLDSEDPSDLSNIFGKSTGKSSGELHRKDELIGNIGSEIGGNLTKKIYTSLVGENNSITEQVSRSQIGKDCVEKNGQYFCLGKLNKKIYSPVTGLVVSFKNESLCKNAITISFEEKDLKNYIQYCGIDTPKVSLGEKISKGSLLGNTESDFSATLYDFDRSKKKKKVDQNIKSSVTNPLHREDPIMGLIGSAIASPLNIFKDKYDSEGNRIEKRWASPTDPEPADHTWFKKWSPTYPKKTEKEKVDEDIKRLKRLIK